MSWKMSSGVMDKYTDSNKTAAASKNVVTRVAWVTWKMRSGAMDEYSDNNKTAATSEKHVTKVA